MGGETCLGECPLTSHLVYLCDCKLFVFPTRAHENLCSYLSNALLNQDSGPSFCVQTLPACSAPPSLLVVEVKSLITESFLLYNMYFKNILKVNFSHRMIFIRNYASLHIVLVISYNIITPSIDSFLCINGNYVI